MASSNRASRRVRRFGAGVGVAGVAAMIGLATAAAANADDLDPVPSTDGPLYAAYLAGEQLEANETLVPHDLPVAYDSLYNAQLPIEQNAIAALASTEALQVPNADNITGFDNLIVTDVDQYFANSASDFSTAVTTFESGDVTTTTALNLLGDDFQLANATNYVNLLDDIFPYLGIESSSAVAGAATAVDPSSFVDLLSSIGL